MANILIRNIDEGDLARIDEQASRVGLSRNEYLLRMVQREARGDSDPLTRDDLRRFSDLAAGLADEELMRQAWS